MMLVAVDTMRAAANPWMNLKMIKMMSAGAAAQKNEEMVKSANPAVNMSLYRPVLSAIFPKIRSEQPRESRYATRTQEVSEAFAAKSCASSGRMIETMLESR